VHYRFLRWRESWWQATASNDNRQMRPSSALAFSVQSSEEDSPARSASWFQPRYWLALTKSSDNDVLYRSAECLLLAQSGHHSPTDQCPLLGAKRTLIGHNL
jgi:hypothetical protein